MAYPWSPGAILTATDLNAAIAAAGSGTQTWTSPIAGGITLGNGTVAANYIQVGKTVLAQFRLVLGSTTSITGSVSLTLPVTSLDFNGGGSGRLVDTSAATRYAASADWTGTTSVIIRCSNTASTYDSLNALTSTVPFTWASTDEIAVALNYLAA